MVMDATDKRVRFTRHGQNLKRTNESGPESCIVENFHAELGAVLRDTRRPTLIMNKRN